MCVRLVFGLHATWAVNSVTHMWGGRRFSTRDDSRNNWWVALLTFGEGWHNNHHAHPTSARHGLAWYEVDFSWIQISVLKSLGLAKSIRVAKVQTPLADREAA
jgi:stearoyl-CoA desaturase (Delta-9 desaturase)